MQKISGILPANARVTTVDIKASGAMRGGMPSFGREIGVTAAAQKKIELEAAAKFNLQSSGPNASASQFEHKNLMNIRKENADPKATIVTDMAEKFFMNKLNQPKEEIQMPTDENSDLVPTTSAPIGLSKELSASDANSAEADESKELGLVDLSQIAKTPQKDEGDEDALLVGQYLDVQA
jgi:hypothetical protein